MLEEKDPAHNLKVAGSNPAPATSFRVADNGMGLAGVKSWKPFRPGGQSVNG
jgi:hypothetical protein